jgi:hypothetical protein
MFDGTATLLFAIITIAQQPHILLIANIATNSLI